MTKVDHGGSARVTTVLLLVLAVFIGQLHIGPDAAGATDLETTPDRAVPHAVDCELTIGQIEEFFEGASALEVTGSERERYLEAAEASQQLADMTEVLPPGVRVGDGDVTAIDDVTFVHFELFGRALDGGHVTVTFHDGEAVNSTSAFALPGAGPAGGAYLYEDAQLVTEVHFDDIDAGLVDEEDDVAPLHHGGTGSLWDCFESGLAQMGVPFYLITLVAATCTVACIITAGFGCLLCASAVLGAYSGVGTGVFYHCWFD